MLASRKEKQLRLVFRPPSGVGVGVGLGGVCGIHPTAAPGAHPPWSRSPGRPWGEARLGLERLGVKRMGPCVPERGRPAPPEGLRAARRPRRRRTPHRKTEARRARPSRGWGRRRPPQPTRVRTRRQQPLRVSAVRAPPAVRARPCRARAAWGSREERGCAAEGPADLVSWFRAQALRFPTSTWKQITYQEIRESLQPEHRFSVWERKFFFLKFEKWGTSEHFLISLPSKSGAFCSLQISHWLAAWQLCQG